MELLACAPGRYWASSTTAVKKTLIFILAGCILLGWVVPEQWAHSVWEKHPGIGIRHWFSWPAPCQETATKITDTNWLPFQSAGHSAAQCLYQLHRRWPRNPPSDQTPGLAVLHRPRFRSARRHPSFRWVNSKHYHKLNDQLLNCCTHIDVVYDTCIIPHLVTLLSKLLNSRRNVCGPAVAFIACTVRNEQTHQVLITQMGKTIKQQSK